MDEEYQEEPPRRADMEAPLRAQGSTPFQQRLMDAVTGSEFHESTEFGVTVHRRGQELHISYDQALEYLGMKDPT